MLNIMNMTYEEAMKLLKLKGLLGDNPLILTGIEIFAKASDDFRPAEKYDCMVIDQLPPFAKFGPEGEKVGLKIALSIRQFAIREKEVYLINPAHMCEENYGKTICDGFECTTNIKLRIIMLMNCKQ